MVTSLNRVKLSSMRKYAARSQRFVDAYRTGLKGEAAAYAVKTYRSHQACPEAAYRAIDAQTN
ncbi:hypothetical protein FRC12_003015 [Ceratobasidium sp. 428]|nr:hypothetical protein FRC12_003015 [Ceratobasidium sp. 428]